MDKGPVSCPDGCTHWIRVNFDNGATWACHEGELEELEATAKQGRPIGRFYSNDKVVITAVHADSDHGAHGLVRIGDVGRIMDMDMMTLKTPRCAACGPKKDSKCSLAHRHCDCKTAYKVAFDGDESYWIHAGELDLWQPDIKYDCISCPHMVIEPQETDETRKVIHYCSATMTLNNPPNVFGHPMTLPFLGLILETRLEADIHGIPTPSVCPLNTDQKEKQALYEEHIK